MSLVNSTTNISRDESATIKGILILLIVLGHNQFFTTLTEKVQLMGYLYCFHIQSFFLLNYSYPIKPLNKERIINHFVRYYVPFCILFLTLTFLRYGTGAVIQWKKLPLVFFMGGGTFLRQFTGIQILWFLPAFFSTVILKEYWAYCSNYGKKVFFYIGGLVVAFSISLPLFPTALQEVFNKIKFIFYYPLIGIQYLFCGLLFRCFVTSKISFKTEVSLFILGTLLYFIDYFYIALPIWGWHNHTPLLGILSLGMPFLFLHLLLRNAERLAQVTWLKKIGENSFIIYLVHPFIGYVLFELCPQKSTWYITMLLPSLFLMLASGYASALLLKQFPALYKLLFPQNKNEWFAALHIKTKKNEY